MASDVLLIEDEAHITEAIRFLLTRAGLSLRHAGDGPAGLAALAQEKPGLVILDAMLPGLDGLAVLARLRRESAFDDLPVLMLSAKSQAGAQAAALAAGADLFMAKPFANAELVAAVQKLLAGRPVPAPERGAAP